MHIAVDLDGTLAEYKSERDPNFIGKPIKAMVDKVTDAIYEGHKISIFTARVSEEETAAAAISLIQNWITNVAGLPNDLEITSTKKKYFDEFWDDRAVRITPNTGVAEIGGHKDTGNHYRYSYKGIKLDPARIMAIYKNPHTMAGSIVKKALVAGERGQKDLLQDIDDIICAAVRWREMVLEDKE